VVEARQAEMLEKRLMAAWGTGAGGGGGAAGQEAADKGEVGGGGKDTRGRREWGQSDSDKRRLSWGGHSKQLCRQCASIQAPRLYAGTAPLCRHRASMQAPRLSKAGALEAARRMAERALAEKRAHA
jgi:hypothetical protein